MLSDGESYESASGSHGTFDWAQIQNAPAWAQHHEVALHPHCCGGTVSVAGRISLHSITSVSAMLLRV